MIRFAILFVVLAVLAALAAWLAGQGGALLLDWRGYRIETSPFVAALAVLIVVAPSAIAYHAWRWLRAGPARLGAARAADRRKRGLRALAQGLSAIAAGDSERALRSARRAEALLDEPPLTLLLSAQAAQMVGDDIAARGYFTAMLSEPDTEFLGLRGLALQAERAGDRERALGFARRAHAKSPDSPWAIRTRFALEAEQGQWREVEALLRPQSAARAFPPDEARRGLVIARFEQAKASVAAGRRDEALQLVREAHKIAPSFVPATLLFAQLAREAERPRLAQAALRVGWARHPHALLFDEFRTLFASRPASDLLKRVERLASFAPTHRESRLAIAAAAMAAASWKRARETLTPLLMSSDAESDHRLCLLMSDLARAEGDDAAAALWAERAARATPRPNWTCTVCGAKHETWTPYCPACHSFASLDAFGAGEMPAMTSALAVKAAANPPSTTAAKAPPSAVTGSTQSV